ncbi:MAG: NAD(P)/FAD-dependent oxidoreductase [Castellaniella sp.]|uniref:NAD(P)/FAD-dependent oxidoreductase n=1 Tax=Castellaniella sp. TaxID=1955812 RepID=UPI0012084CA9|nr:NAD(P)/FAD-dependent oxidoreductase [Castellaniella sp.]TAN27940.1 MAG: NAD(P)/FAD-dependent oxidoreductase [Castellaniella sp.]
MTKIVLIAGAGPAGLTAALELLRRSDCIPIVFESLDDVGGISRTINHHGNRMDIGGHRFFSKSDWVMQWWRDMMPVAPGKTADGLSLIPEADRHLLVRPRLSRIYFLRKFFSYPVSLSAQTLRNLGVVRLLRIGFSYAWACLFKRKPERNLEDFFVNRFGKALYATFFRDYTEKVWGRPCSDISPEWGAQRIKGLSILSALRHAAGKLLSREGHDLAQKRTNTSLIERFLYPKYGPGQMWHIVADEVRARGGQIHLGHKVTAVQHADGRVVSVTTKDSEGHTRTWEGDHFISTMPISELVAMLHPAPPAEVQVVGSGLCYRDFITLGLLVKKLKPTAQGRGPMNLVPDTWIYIQEPDVKIGRLQIFNNWSPSLVTTPDAIWMGLEYFCQEGDELWSMSEAEFFHFAVSELEKIDLIDAADVVDHHLVHVPKAYPAYFGSYDQFSVIREYTDTIANLYLVGRNGMHRYNNQDHSMLTAKLAVDDIIAGNVSKREIWEINVDDEYHEEKRSTS